MIYHRPVCMCFGFFSPIRHLVCSKINLYFYYGLAAWCSQLKIKYKTRIDNLAVSFVFYAKWPLISASRPRSIVHWEQILLVRVIFCEPNPNVSRLRLYSTPVAKEFISHVYFGWLEIPNFGCVYERFAWYAFQSIFFICKYLSWNVLNSLSLSLCPYGQLSSIKFLFVFDMMHDIQIECILATAVSVLSIT